LAAGGGEVAGGVAADDISPRWAGGAAGSCAWDEEAKSRTARQTGPTNSIFIDIPPFAPPILARAPSRNQMRERSAHCRNGNFLQLMDVRLFRYLTCALENIFVAANGPVFMVLCSGGKMTGTER
jgi:hypothetical protein